MWLHKVVECTDKNRYNSGLSKNEYPATQYGKSGNSERYANDSGWLPDEHRTKISVEDAGAIYIELSSIRGNFMANIILRMIENYHFLPDMAQKLKNKQALVESVIANEQQEPSITSPIKDVYDDLVNSKLDMIEGFVPISAIQYDAKMQEAERL